MHQPPWMCHNANCPFRNRLLADARLTTPHVCSQAPPIPVFVNPFPPPKPITILPPPPLAPAPSVPLSFPQFPLSPQTACFPTPSPPLPMMSPIPIPPAPSMWPTPPAPTPVQAAATATPAPEQKPRSASPDVPKSPSTASFVHEKNVHKYEPKKGPISKCDKEALADFEERTRRQDYRDLAESNKQQSSQKSETEPASNPPGKPRSILKTPQTTTPAVRQEVTVNIYSRGHQIKEDGVHNSTSSQTVPAKDAASVREEAIKRARSLAQGVPKATAPAAVMSGGLKPSSKAGSCAPAKPSSHPSTKAHSREPTVKNATPTPPKMPSKASSKAPSTTNTKSTRVSSHHHNPPAGVVATAGVQVSPSSIESWLESVRRLVPV